MKEVSEAAQIQLDEAIFEIEDEAKSLVTLERLATFLQKTEFVPLPPSERLRQLAIALEHHSFERGWDDLRAIYHAAVELTPDDFYLHHSFGLAALAWMEEWMTPVMADRLAIAAQAERSFTRALELEPQDSDTAFGLGSLFYNHPLRKEDHAAYLATAKAWYQKAIANDSTNVMAQLYVAHCCHDLAFIRADENLWWQAVIAYEQVDQVALARDWPLWRAVKCREQLAVCCVWAGQAAIGKQRLSAFLDEVEALVPAEDGDHEAIVNFNELVDVVTKKLKDTVLLQRTCIQVKRFQLESLYPELYEN